VLVQRCHLGGINNSIDLVGVNIGEQGHRQARVRSGGVEREVFDLSRNSGGVEVGERKVDGQGGVY